MLQSTVSRDALYEADEWAVDWRAHQGWRIDQLFEREQKKRGLPRDQLRLACQARFAIELMSRNGSRVKYRPEGVIEAITVPSTADGLYAFEMAWVDPWGFAHQCSKTFMEVRLQVIDELTYKRREKVVADALEAMKAYQHSR